MSILIKGLNMPKDDDMNITITKDGRIYWDNKYHMIAQAVEIPTPHGRLIDGDELIEAHYKYCNEHHGEADTFYMWSKDLMDNAPTILEAEE